jgi:predicted secreted protein
MEKRMLKALLTLVLAAVAPLAAAQVAPAPAAGAQVELTGEATREVANDQMTAVMVVESTDANAAALATLLNRTTADAQRAAAEFGAVKVRTGGSQTYPVYDRANKQTGWRGRAEVRLESRDFQQMAQLVARLQTSMQLAGISFAVSPELRRQTENELINEAVNAFRARADIAAKSLGARGYRIKRVSINSGTQFGQPRPVMRMAAASAEAAPPPPSFEGGTSQVQVNVQGTVEVE